LTLREFVPTEEANGNRVTRRIHATGQALIHPGDSFDDLSQHIIAPVVDEWLSGKGSHTIAPGLGRPVDIRVNLDPVGRGIADVTITAAFVSATV
jgi:hypothetical protein